MEGNQPNQPIEVEFPRDREEQLALYFGANERIQHYQRKIQDTETDFVQNVGAFCDHQTQVITTQKDCNDLRAQIEKLQKELFGLEAKKEMHVLKATHILECMLKMKTDATSYVALRDKATNELKVLIELLRTGVLTNAASAQIPPQPQPLSLSSSLSQQNANPVPIPVAAPLDPRLRKTGPSSALQELIEKLQTPTPAETAPSFPTTEATEQVSTELNQQSLYDDTDVPIKRERESSEEAPEGEHNRRQSLRRPNKFRVPAMKRPPIRYCEYFNRRNGCYKTSCNFAHRCSTCGSSNHGAWDCGVEFYDRR